MADIDRIRCAGAGGKASNAPAISAIGDVHFATGCCTTHTVSRIGQRRARGGRTGSQSNAIVETGRGTIAQRDAVGT
ncbi:hypothetical protein, partial [Pseudomonas chlororaphis]|uniref:hypothetical protein n=1 Tax=Pseudomonas chlororaphis TaxID=587753 RepID=UPI001B33F003